MRRLILAVGAALILIILADLFLFGDYTVTEEMNSPPEQLETELSLEQIVEENRGTFVHPLTGE